MSSRRVRLCLLLGLALIAAGVAMVLLSRSTVHRYESGFVRELRDPTKQKLLCSLYDLFLTECAAQKTHAIHRVNFDKHSKEWQQKTREVGAWLNLSGISIISLHRYTDEERQSVVCLNVYSAPLDRRYHLYLCAEEGVLGMEDRIVLEEGCDTVNLERRQRYVVTPRIQISQEPTGHLR